MIRDNVIRFYLQLREVSSREIKHNDAVQEADSANTGMTMRLDSARGQATNTFPREAAWPK
jgi:hypothetical protein